MLPLARLTQNSGGSSRKAVGQVKIPVLVLWGDSDRIFTPEYGRVFAGAFPDAEFTIIADAGHLPHLEEPAATFDALDSYLRRPSSQIP